MKFHGRQAEGFLVFTGNEVVSIYYRGDLEAVDVRRNPLRDIVEFNAVAFKLGIMSLAYVGKGYEVLFHDHRLLFRIALLAQDDKFDRIFTNRLHGTHIPLFKGLECVKWVAADSPNNPEDETGKLRHYPY
jgi:hypothetical protein